MAAYARLLGIPQLVSGEEELELPSGKTSALLYYLAYGGRWVSRDELLYLFWPDSEEEKARSNLRKLLSGVRKLPYTSDLEIEATRLRWPISTDVAEFKQAMAERDPSKAVQLYEGELLQGFSAHEAPEFESWLELERHELQKAYREAVLALADELENSRRHPQAAEILERLYKTDLFDEEVLRRYLQALYRSGQRGKALEAFEHFTRRLQDEMDGEPEDETLELVEHIKRKEPLPSGMPTGIVPAGAVSRQKPHHNLPVQPTAFVGREAEKARIAELLGDPACRLLTLVGPGGVGKTRLAIEVAEGQLEAFSDGVYFASFVAVGSPELMVYTVADAIGFSFFGQREPKEQLLDYLQDKEMLLVLDNLEHLLSGIHLVGEVLENAPHIKVLATSRERLNLHAERVFDLRGLSFPQPPLSRGALERSDKRGDKAGPQDYDALKLFAQSASNVRLDFTLDEATLPAVTRVCQLLQGLPLAIELASSWLRALTLEDIAAEIERGIDFLKASTRDLPTRHQSIRAVFDYSWKLLTKEEQAVLRKLSVCRGGFRREAAAEIAGANLPILASLIDKSFLTITPTGRYRRHPLVLQYTQEKLAEHPEERAQAEKEHGLYYLRFVREREGDLRTRKRKVTLSAIEEELPNIRAAWSWAIANQRVDEIKASVPALGEAYRNRMPEGEALLAQAVAGLDENDPAHHAALGYVLVQQVRYLGWLTPGEQVVACAQRGLELLRPLGEVRGVMRGLHALGAAAYWTAYHNGDFAQAHLQEALALARKHGDSSEIANCLWALAMVEREFGSFPQVKRFFEGALAEVQELGDVLGYVGLQHQLGTYLVHNGFFQEGQALMQESLALAREVNVRIWEVFILDDLALAAYKLGEFDRAEALSFETLNVAEELNLKEPKVKAMAKLGRVATARGHYLEAERYLKESLQLAWSWEYPQHHAVLEAIILLAELAIAQGRALEAAQWLGLVRRQPTFMNEHELEVRRLLETLRNQLSPEALEEALERGKAMDLKRAVEGILRQELLES